jgi:hypothetical protein
VLEARVPEPELDVLVDRAVSGVGAPICDFFGVSVAILLRLLCPDFEVVGGGFPFEFGLGILSFFPDATKG